MGAQLDSDRSHIEQQLDRRIDAILASAPGADLSPRVSMTIQETIQRSLTPVAPLPALWARAGQLLLIFVCVGVLKLALLGTTALQQMTARERLGNVGATLLGATLLSIALARHMTPGGLRRLPSGVALTAVMLGFLIAVAVAVPGPWTSVFIAEGLPCFRAGLVMAIPFGLLYWFLMRRGQPMSFTALSQPLGAMAGLLAATVPTVRQATCSHQEVVGHLLVWHGGVVLVASMAAVLIAYTYRRLTVWHA
jgi:hypothetical protein